jgi:hypothetical protein
MNLMPDTHYILERLNWRRASGIWLNLPGTDRLRSFADRADADALCREREWEVRRKINPFGCGGPFLHYQTAFDAARLFDWCLDAGLDPPGVTNDSRIWADWWATHHEKMTDAQRATVWEALDRVRFFRVMESEETETRHLVAAQHFEEDPIGPRHYGHYEYVGCTPEILAQRASLADGLSHQLFIDALARVGSYVGTIAPPISWGPPEVDPFADEDRDRDWRDWGLWERNQVSFEHRPLAMFADRPLRPGSDVFVVLRRHWRLDQSEVGFWRWCLTSAKSCGRPIAAFNTLVAADECVAQLEAEARRTPALFRFGPPHEWSTIHPTAIYGMLSEIAPVNFTSLWNDYQATDNLWCRWWDEFAPTMTPEQIETVWTLYDKLKFYEVVAVEYRE